MNLDTIDLGPKGRATVRIVVRCGAGEPGDVVTVLGPQARKLVTMGYAELVEARAKTPETAMKPQPQTRGGRTERRG